MRIAELKSGMSRVSIEASVVSISEPRTVNLRDGGTARVADCLIRDDSGQIKLSLWDDQISMVKPGVRVAIENGYTRSFRGENTLNVGRFGKLRVLD